MTLRIPANVRNAALAAVGALADAGSGPGTLKIYTGAQPGAAGAAPTGTLLATFVLTDPAYGAPSAGSMALDADPDISAVCAADGTAGWGRVADSDGNAIYDGACTVSGGGGEFILNEVTLLNGQTVVLLSGSISIPG